MKITIHPTEQVEIKLANGTSLGIFTIESSWQGMTKFVHRDGFIVAAIDKNQIGRDANNMFADLFGEIFNTEPDKILRDAEVIKASDTFTFEEKLTPRPCCQP